MRTYVLTYHSGNIAGNDYGCNDLVTLAADLDLLHRLRIPLIPLATVVRAVITGSSHGLPDKSAVITLDDGLDFDFIDLVHPVHGPQTSVHTLFKDFYLRTGAHPHATSFVIASPAARQRIADAEMLGHQWISDHWWREALDSGYFNIGNHSWDHMSASARAADGADGAGGSFLGVDNPAEADRQVRQARQFIVARAANPADGILAYPYGSGSDYLIKEYLPLHGAAVGTYAAVASAPEPFHEGSNRWAIPRFVCGRDWTTPGQLDRLMRN